jgi:hypothetical protein
MLYCPFSEATPSGSRGICITSGLSVISDTPSDVDDVTALPSGCSCSEQTAIQAG